jgi:MFS transporter, ACS family, glucarate transporter
MYATPMPTRIRYLVLLVTALVSIFMYVDRVCLASVTTDLQKDLKLTDEQLDLVKSAFFWSYALAQVVAGVLSLRFGLRRMLAIYLFLWSFFTGVAGFANGFASLFLFRLLVGLTEAGAYPTMAMLVKNWFPVNRRGFANSMVALGGRFGGVLGQRITPVLVTGFASVNIVGWRGALVLFGAVGVLYSLVFFWLVRDRASSHPWANTAEAELAGPPPTVTTQRTDWIELMSTPNLWYSGVTQFCINIGWAFLITSFPEYLEKAHGLTGDAKGYWASLPLLVGMSGMFFGGFLTDALSKRIGIRWGRALPISISLAACAGAYFVCSQTTNYVIVVVMLCVMTVGVDLGVPAIWAFAQDIGGRQTGAVLGWGNMLGNIGAAVSPLLLGNIQRALGWPAVFAACAMSFCVAVGTGLLMNATKPVEADRSA